MSEKRFSKKHEWVSIEGETATVGITKHATEMLSTVPGSKFRGASSFKNRYTCFYI